MKVYSDNIATDQMHRELDKKIKKMERKLDLIIFYVYIQTIIGVVAVFEIIRW